MRVFDPHFLPFLNNLAQSSNRAECFPFWDFLLVKQITNPISEPWSARCVTLGNSKDKFSISISYLLPVGKNFRVFLALAVVFFL